MRNMYKILVGKLEGREHLENSIDGRITLKWILKEHGGRMWSGFVWIQIRSNVRLL
jgi:hypothetical protein